MEQHTKEKKTRYNSGIKDPTDLDRKIGNLIWDARIRKGFSRQQVSCEIGVTHQQLQKYEKGVNRLSIGRFIAICNIINLEPMEVLNAECRNTTEKEGQRQRACIELVRSFNSLDQTLQDTILKLMRVLSKEG